MTLGSEPKIPDCLVQGEMGPPGPRGPEGAPGKGIPGEKVKVPTPSDAREEDDSETTAGKTLATIFNAVVNIV